MAIKQDPSTILGTQNDPIASSTEIALAVANGGIFQYQTTKDVYVTAVSQRITNQQVFNNNTVNEVAGTTPGEIQFYSDGKFGADKDFRYDSGTDSLLVSGNLYAGKINLASASSLQIPGGMPGYILTTDGTGALSWQPEVSTLPASNITFIPPAGMVSTEVQSAITELNTKKLALAGGTMTGPLTLAADPTTNLGAATKAYVDNISRISNGTSNVEVAASGNVTVAAAGNTVLVVTGTGINVAGTLNATGDANVGNIGAEGGIFTYVTGDGGNLSNITGANVVGNVDSAITANFANYAGNVTVAAQPNITSVGILTSLEVAGNANAGNIGATGGIFTYVTGDGANLTGITGANVVGNVDSAITANFANYAGNVTVASQPNITSVGTLTSLDVAGNVDAGNIGATGGIFTYVTGDGANLTGITTANFANFAGNVTVAAQPNITSVGTLTSLAVAGNANAGNIGAAGGIFTYVTGDGGNLSNITGANVAGNVTSAITANFANFAGNVTVAAQPNITSVGTLLSLAVSGNANAGNIGATGGIFTYVTGDGANLTNINGANITGAAAFATTANSVAGANVVGNVTSAITANFANFAGNVTVAAQPNITSVGTLTSLAVSGNANAGNIGAAGGIFTYVTGDGGNLSNITGANITGAIAFATTANSVAGANVSGQVPFAAVANSVAGANVVGNVTSAITANFANFAGNITVNAQPNITSVGTLTSLDVTGTATAGNVSTAGNVVAAGNIQADTAFIGNAFTTRTGPLTLTATGASDITLAVGTGNINLSTSTNITNVKDPVSAQDAATKNYVDTLAQGLKPKASVQCATAAAITLAPAPATIDGYTLASGDRVLVKNQAAPADNGIYSFDGTNLVRATDADSAADLPDGTFVFIESGSTYAASAFTLVSVVSTLGTDPVTFVQFSTGGTYTAGSGLTLTGSQFSVSSTAVTAGGYGNATHVPSFTVSATGQLTAAGATAVTANAETLTGTFIPASVTTASGLTSIGTLTSLAVTGAITAGSFAGDGGNLSNIRAANVVGTMSSLTVAGPINLAAVGNITITGGTSGQYLQTNGSGALTWATVSVGATIASSITSVPAGNLVATNVQDALDELDSEKAVLASPTFTGVPGAPTAAVGTNTTQIATTAFVQAEIASSVPAASETVAGKIELATLAEVAAGTDTTRAVTAAGLKPLLDGKSTGPAGPVVDNTVARFDGTTGKIIKDGVVIISDAGVVTGVSTLTTTGALTVGGVSTLGPVGNVSITGGTNGQVLTTNGSGVLAWSSVSAGGPADASSVTTVPAGNLAATNVQTALNELDSEKLNVSGGTVTGALTIGGVSTLGPVGNVKITGGTNGQVLTTDGTGTLSWTTVSAGGPASASSVTSVAAGNLAATNVQAALNELDTEKAALASPTFTGVPLAPTAALATNTTQLATTAFVQAQIGSSVPAASDTVAGKVELATVAEVATGTSTTLAVTPAGLKPLLDGKSTGAASSTDNAVVRFDGATGKIIQNSSVIISDGGAITGVTDFTMSGSYVAGLTSGLTTVVGINCALDNYFKITVTAAQTFSAINVPATGSVYSMTLEILTSGSAAITWPASVYWPNGTAPTLSATGKTTLIMMVTTDGGAKWRATSLIDYTT
jgi:hypothetical protein